MERYHQNAKWLTYFTPFRMLSISAAYLTPFFLLHDLSLSQIFVLQSIFSGASLLWELPSGYIADRFGRAFSIKLSAPIAALAMASYGLSTQYGQFVICEIVLALASGLLSGIDTALLVDSLRASGHEKDFTRISQRMSSFGYAATALGVPVALALVHFSGLSATLIADALLTAFGALITLKLVEAPHFEANEGEERASAWQAALRLTRNIEVRWLVLLTATLATATYLGFWLSAPYYQSLGIPVVWFSAILAARSLWKAWLAHRIVQSKHIEQNMVVYALLTGFTYVAMATGQLWLVWAVFGHDVVQALQSAPLVAALNTHMAHRHRATLNSLVNVVQRLFYTVSGPLLGLLVDRAGMATGFLAVGASATSLALLAIWRLHRLGTLSDR